MLPSPRCSLSEMHLEPCAAFGHSSLESLADLQADEEIVHVRATSAQGYREIDVNEVPGRSLVAAETQADADVGQPTAAVVVGITGEPGPTGVHEHRRPHQQQPER